VILLLILAHLLYDFHWQGSFIAENKGKYVFILAVHALTWACLLSAVLMFYGRLLPWHLVFLAMTHFVCDGWKCQMPKDDKHFWALYVDQAIHFATIAVVAFWR